MENTSKARSDGELWILEDTQILSDLIFGSRTVKHAISSLSNQLSAASIRLLFAGVYDIRKEEKSFVAYSDFPESLTSLCARFDNRQGCPLVQIALKGKQPFEALNLYLAGFDDFFSMKYLREMKNLNHERIGVFPIFSGSQAFVFFAGYEGSEHEEKVLRLLNTVFCQMVCGLSIKYKTENLTDPNYNDGDTGDLVAGFERISRRQKECLFWLAHGKDVTEISKAMNLSEHTVGQCIMNACKILKAKSTSHAIALAVQSGILDCRL